MRSGSPRKSMTQFANHYGNCVIGGSGDEPSMKRRKSRDLFVPPRQATRAGGCGSAQCYSLAHPVGGGYLVQLVPPLLVLPGSSGRSTSFR
eukprot:1845942-Prymnesium_polylepis.2